MSQHERHGELSEPLFLMPAATIQWHDVRQQLESQSNIGFDRNCSHFDIEVEPRFEDGKLRHPADREI